MKRSEYRNQVEENRTKVCHAIQLCESIIVTAKADLDNKEIKFEQGERELLNNKITDIRVKKNDLVSAYRGLGYLYEQVAENEQDATVSGEYDEEKPVYNGVLKTGRSPEEAEGNIDRLMTEVLSWIRKHMDQKSIDLNIVTLDRENRSIPCSDESKKTLVKLHDLIGAHLPKVEEVEVEKEAEEEVAAPHSDEQSDSHVE